jgi:hypothetical protein
MYYCQDGQTAPPVGSLGWSLLAVQQGSDAVPSTQLQGVTCLGPQEHSLDTMPVINVGNPNTVWNVFPGDEVRLRHYVQVIGLAPTITFGIDADKAGFGWRLFKGDENAPSATEVDTSKPYTASPRTEHFWLVGAVPTGTTPGATSLTFRVTKGADPSIHSSSTDMLWVGQWVAPPTPVAARYDVYLPLVTRQ